MKVLIITDGTEFIQTVALSIKDSLTGMSNIVDIEAKICLADNFQGDELLPIDVFFIGAEKPSPGSFSWLEEFFSHINLSSRKCGIFGLNTDTTNYLLSILRDCEVNVFEPLLVKDGALNNHEIKDWTNQIIK
jgi:hypothetical protein